MRKLFIIAIVFVSLAITINARADTTYFRELAERKVTYLSDGVYGVCLLMGVADKYNNFESQKEFLKEKGILPLKLIDSKGDVLLRKGTTAYMVCKALDIKGGVMLHVAGSSEKYALRELTYKEIISEGPRQKIVSGKELLSILMRASDYKAKK